MLPSSTLRRTIAVALAASIGSLCMVATSSSARLPGPDYDAIVAAAQETGYLAVLSDRIDECWRTAEPYAASPIADEKMEARKIRVACLRAMMRRLQELYFVEDAFEAGGIDARVEEVSKPLNKIFEGLNSKGPLCRATPCGPTQLLAARDQYVWFLSQLMDLMAAANGEGEIAEYQEGWIRAAGFPQATGGSGR